MQLQDIHITTSIDISTLLDAGLFESAKEKIVACSVKELKAMQKRLSKLLNTTKPRCYMSKHHKATFTTKLEMITDELAKR